MGEYLVYMKLYQKKANEVTRDWHIHYITRKDIKELKMHFVIIFRWVCYQCGHEGKFEKSIEHR